MDDRKATPFELRRLKTWQSNSRSISEANVYNGSWVAFAKNGYVHIAAISICLALSIVYYHLSEDWSIVDSVFFVMTTVTSVGYGDDYPSTTNTRTFTIFLMLFGAIILFGEVSQFLNVGMTKMDDFLKRSDITMLKKTEVLFKRRAVHSAFWVICYSLLGAMFLQLLEPEWSYFTAVYFIVQTITVRIVSVDRSECFLRLRCKKALFDSLTTFVGCRVWATETSTSTRTAPRCSCAAIFLAPSVCLCSPSTTPTVGSRLSKPSNDAASN
ncbi:MAG: potassium channel family protein [Rickettsiales bacterium]